MARTRLSSRRRKWKPVSDSSTIGSVSARPGSGFVRISCRQSGRTGSSTPNASPTSAEYAPAATTRMSASTSSPLVRPELHPALDRAANELLA